MVNVLLRLIESALTADRATESYRVIDLQRLPADLRAFHEMYRPAYVAWAELFLGSLGRRRRGRRLQPGLPREGIALPHFSGAGPPRLRRPSGCGFRWTA
jgi:hypothetical protein